MFIGAVGSWYWQGKLRHNLRFLEFSNIKLSPPEILRYKKPPYSRPSFLTKPSTETSKCTTQNSRGLTIG